MSLFCPSGQNLRDFSSTHPSYPVQIDAMRLRQNPGFARLFNPIAAVYPEFQKFVFTEVNNRALIPPPSPNRRTFRPIVTKRGGVAMDAEARGRCALKRTVKPCGPDPPTLGPS